MFFTYILFTIILSSTPLSQKALVQYYQSGREDTFVNMLSFRMKPLAFTRCLRCGWNLKYSFPAGTVCTKIIISA